MVVGSIQIWDDDLQIGKILRRHNLKGERKTSRMARMSFSMSWPYLKSVQFDFPAIYDKAKDAFSKNWYLGFTAFGGPPVHFHIVSYDINTLKWLKNGYLTNIYAAA
jgi:hypothetical protein